MVPGRAHLALLMFCAMITKQALTFTSSSLKPALAHRSTLPRSTVLRTLTETSVRLTETGTKLAAGYSNKDYDGAEDLHSDIDAIAPPTRKGYGPLATNPSTLAATYKVDYSRGPLDGRYRPGVYEPSAAVHAPLPNALSSFTTTPSLVTLDCTGTLIQLTSQVGMFYREELFKATDCNARLPPPSVFSDSFFVAYKAMDEAHPCFGAASTPPLSSEAWWRQVVRATFDGVSNIDLEPGLREELELEGEDTLFETVFQRLYKHTFQTADGWQLRPGVREALEAIREWKRSPDGPKMVGLISNFDERLHPLLENLGIAKYVDFVITSREVGTSKPSRSAFDAALAKCGCSAAEAVHVGDSFKNDVMGAAEAGWHPVFIPSMEETVSSPASANAGKHAREREAARDSAGETNEGVSYTQVGDLNSFLTLFGKAPENRVIMTTQHITEVGNDGDALYQFD